MKNGISVKTSLTLDTSHPVDVALETLRYKEFKDKVVSSPTTEDAYEALSQQALL